MNRIYRTLWSVATQSWQAVPETAKSAGKKSKSSAGGVLASVALGLSLVSGANAQAPPAVNQLPTGGSVARGTATISQTATAQAAAMTVNQASQRAVINWNTFNVGSNASVNFVQPNAQAVTLNRVNDSNPSQIFGRISANGQVFLTNANGVYFSPTSSVDVGALTATTHSITDDNFMSGNYVFDRNGATGKIINEGNITAALGGYVALLAPEVQNAGVVVARAGTVAMAAGETITLNIDGVGGLAGITTTPSAIASLIDNKLAVQAPDGQIILSAVALNKLQAGLIKNSGTLEANSLVNKGGKIVLEADQIAMDRNSKIEAKGPLGGGTVLVGGDWQGSGTLRQATKVTMEAGATIDASATDNGDGGKVVLWSDVSNADSLTQVSGSIKSVAGPNGGNGGKVETSGHSLKLGDAVQVKTGQWLLDPYDFTVAATGGDITGASLSGLLGSSNNITIQASSTSSASNTATTKYGAAGTAGNIFVNDTIAFSANTLTLNAQNNVTINKAMTLTGTAGLSVVYGQGNLASGNASLFAVNAPISIASTGSFSTKLGSDGTLTNYTIVNNLGVTGDATTAPGSPSLQGMAKNLSTSFVLGSDIDASGTATWNSNAGFTPIGNSTAAFSGKFNGLGHTISGLTIAASTTDYLGLFGKTTGSISNVILSTPSITGKNYIGALAGYGASFYNVRILGGSVTGTQYVGGMAGYASATADTVTTSAAVNGQDSTSSAAQYVGGMLGLGQGAINNITGSGAVTVTNTNTALVTGSTATSIINSVGGLVGQFAATTTMTVNNIINTGNVSVTTATSPSTAPSNSLIQDVGGLIGTLGGSNFNSAGNWRVTISNSSTSGNVSVASTTAANMSSNTTNIAQATGGLIGRVDYAGAAGRSFGGGLTLTNLSSSGNVSGYNSVGGVLGTSQLGSSSAGSNVYTNLSASGTITGFGGTIVISNSGSSSPNISYQGVGGVIGANYGTYVAQISSSHFDGGTVKSNGGTHIGGLVGTNTGLITDSYATGTMEMPSTPFTISAVTTDATGVMGGLVGYLGGSSTNAGISGSSYSNVTITLGSAASPIAASFVGGLVGYVGAQASYATTISGAYARGDIKVYGYLASGSNVFSNKIGGLVGASVIPTAITGTADVAADVLTVSGNMLTGSTTTNYLAVGTPVGGPGILPGTYIKALMTGTGGAGTYQLNQSQTTGSALTITAYPKVYIDNSYATGNVSATKSNYLGGLAGVAPAVYNSYAMGNVDGISSLGGLLGQGLTVYNSYALGNVTGTSIVSPSITSYNVGGLVGLMARTVIDGVSRSYWAGQSVSGGNYVGGLIGISDIVNNSSFATFQVVDNSYVTGSGQVQGNSGVGGLVGMMYGNISNSFSTVAVNATSASSNNLGGLVGSWGFVSYAGTLPLINNSWASGKVTGGRLSGGLIGSSAGTVLNSYATGDVVVTGDTGGAKAGGLIGYNLWGGNVGNSFATGDVTSNYASAPASGNMVYLGGLIGYNQSNGSVNNSFASGNVTLNSTGVAGGLIGYSVVPSVATSVGATSSGSNSGTTLNLTGSFTVQGVLGLGATVTDAGGLIPAGTYVVARSSNYAVTLNQSINLPSSVALTFSNATSSSLASISGTTLTLGGTVNGYFAPGTTIKGAGIPAGTYITGVSITSSSPVTGFGMATSTYTLNNSVTSFSGAITGTNTAQANMVTVTGGLMIATDINGGLAKGMVVTGPGIPANTTITGYENRYISGVLKFGYTLSDSSVNISTPITVVAQTLNPTVSNVYATGNVVSNAAYTGTYYSYLGGLVGQMASGVTSGIANGYALGSLPLTTKVSSAVTNSNSVSLVQSNGGNVLTVGTVVSGAGVPDGTYVTQIVSGTGGTGVYLLNNNVTLAANQYLSFSSATMGGVLRGGVIGYVGTGSSPAPATFVPNKLNTNADITSGTVVMPGLSALYFNTTANSGYYGVGNDGVSNNNLSIGTTGLSTIQLRNTANMPGLNFSTSTLGSAARGLGSTGNYWVLVDVDGSYNNAGGATSATYPMLASEYNLKISSTHQLQLMGLDPTASYVLQNSLRFTTTDVWASPGFVPVGTVALPFSGRFTGSALSSGSQLICPSYSGGCTISGLTINSSLTDPVGLFGTVSSTGVISGVRLLNANVSGAGTVGAVVGANAGNLTFSSSSGSVSSSNTTTTTYGVGGIVGQNNSTGTIDRVFSVATVTGNGAGATNMLVGGVVGNNNGGTLSNAYAAGTGTLIRSSGFAGGLAGANSGTISNSYATEPVAGASTVSGGLVGDNTGGTLTNSFWDTTTTGKTAAVASGGSAGTLNDNAGMVTAQMQTLANYNSSTTANGNHNPGWDLTSVWNPPVATALYPALRDFLIPITVTANAITKVYDGTAYTSAIGAASVRYSLPNVTLSGNAVYESSMLSDLNVGSYTVMPTGLYSNQYNVTFASGTLTITKKPLTFTASLTPKVYDGTKSMDPSNITINGLVGSQTLTITSVDAVSALVSANTSNYINSIVLADGTNGGFLSNYSAPTTLTHSNAPVTILAKSLTVVGVTAANKEYDGTTTASVSGGVLTGVLDVDSALVGISNTGIFSSRNTANGISVSAVLNGAASSNYALTQPVGLSANITAKPVTITDTGYTSIYDGSTYGALATGTHFSVGTLVGSDSVTSVTQTASGAGVTSTGVAQAGSFTVTPSAAVMGTGLASNYSFSYVAATDIVTQRPITVTVDTKSRVYGDANPALTYTVAADGVGTSRGLVNSDSLGTLSTTAGNTSIVGSYTIDASALANSNYLITANNGSLTVTQRPITVTADAKSRVYGDANPALTYTVAADGVGTSRGLVNSDSLGTLSTTAGNTSIVGSYTIDASALANSNYLITANNGSLTIAPRSVTLTGQMNYSGQPTLDTTQTGTTLSATNVVQGDSLTVSGTATLASAAAGTRAITAFNSLTLSNSNYTTTGASGSVNVIPTGGINVTPLNNNEVAALIGSQLAGLTGSQIAAFSTTQLQVFSWQQIAALSPSQFAALSPAQLASLSAAQLQGLSAAQMSFMTPAQLGGLTPSQFAGLSNAQLQAMSAAQVRGISTAQLSLLSPAQIALLTGNAATPLSLQQIMALTPAQLGGMSTVQVARLTAAEVSSLSDAQLHALSLEQLAAISPASLAALSSEQIMALSLTQVASLTPEQLSSLSPTQIASLSAEEVASFNTLQLAAIGIFPAVITPDEAPVVTAKFEAPIPVMTEVAAPNVPAVEVATPVVTPVTPSVSTVEAAPVAITATDANAHTGVLAITVFSGADARPITTGVAFEQDANSVSLRLTSAPSVPPVSAKLVFNDKLTTFMVAHTNGQMVEFQGGLINKRLIIVAPSSAAKQIARADMNMVLAAAITSLGAENRVVLANLDGVVIDLR